MKQNKHRKKSANYESVIYEDQTVITLCISEQRHSLAETSGSIWLHIHYPHLTDIEHWPFPIILSIRIKHFITNTHDHHLSFVALNKYSSFKCPCNRRLTAFTEGVLKESGLFLLLISLPEWIQVPCRVKNLFPYHERSLNWSPFSSCRECKRVVLCSVFISLWMKTKQNYPSFLEFPMWPSVRNCTG